MNAQPRRSNPNIDWVINYVEVNSRPASTDDFCCLRITNSELRIDPAGIVLTFGESTAEGIQLQCGSESYFGTLVQRGSEIVVRIHRSEGTGNIVIVAKRIVSGLELPYPFNPTGDAAESTIAQSMDIEPRSFF